jgi:putative nucleotidyltransferase with HDIG domain
MLISGGTPMSDKSRILFVDDEPRILDVFSTSLADEGYFVKTASSAEQAHRIARSERFDIAFVDQFLGPTRGIELMHSLAAVRPDLSFVIITANGSADLAVEALKRGAADFLMKPFFLADLVRSIDYVQKKRSLEQEKRQLMAGLEQTVQEKTDELNKVYTHVLATLAAAMEQRDSGTYGHSRRVSYNARLIAAALDLTEADRADLKTAALLHDIGKIGITDFILGKEGPLTGAERDTIKSHPQKGVEILKPLRHFERILPGILHHHENYDGSGYPSGLAGEQIPLHARIIAVADTYDAILSTRPYRSASDRDKAVNELLAHSGRQFDPAIVDAFLTGEAKYRALMRPD